MRLINADTLVETIASNVYPVADYWNSRDYGMFWTGGIEKAINEAPTIDAVEVVRCKDCKHRPNGDGANHHIEFPDDVCPCQCDDYWYSWMPKDDWFCADGERMDDELQRL